MRANFFVCALVTTAALSIWNGCSKSEDPTPQKSEAAAQVELTHVTVDRKDLLFRYLNDQGEFEQSLSIDEIPQEKRDKVLVVDLSLSPELRGASQNVQLFDLRQPNENGEFLTGRFVPRTNLEQELAKKQQFVAPPPQEPIILYATSWCPHCRRARDFMKQHNLAYTEKDVEKTPGAQAELAAKAKKQGVDASGVPVFDIGGKIVSGFDGNTVLKLARPQKQTAVAPNQVTQPQPQKATLTL